MFVLEQNLPILLLFLLPGFDHLLGARAGAGVHYMRPVLVRAQRKLLPTFDNENTGVADLALSCVKQSEAALETFRVPLTVSEPRAERVINKKSINNFTQTAMESKVMI